MCICNFASTAFLFLTSANSHIILFVCVCRCPFRYKNQFQLGGKSINPRAADGLLRFSVENSLSFHLATERMGSSHLHIFLHMQGERAQWLGDGVDMCEVIHWVHLFCWFVQMGCKENALFVLFGGPIRVSWFWVSRGLGWIVVLYVVFINWVSFHIIIFIIVFVGDLYFTYL